MISKTIGYNGVHDIFRHTQGIPENPGKSIKIIKSSSYVSHFFRGQVPIFSLIESGQDSELPLLQDRGEPAEAPRAHRAPW